MTVTLPGIARKRGARPQPPPTSNVRQHWRAKASIDAKWRAAAFVCLVAEGGSAFMLPSLRLRVTLTRLHTRGAGPDFARLVGSLTAVQDGVCDWLFAACRDHDEYRRTHEGRCGSLHDEDPRIEWRFEKRKGEAPGVEIVVEVLP